LAARLRAQGEEGSGAEQGRAIAVGNIATEEKSENAETVSWQEASAAPVAWLPPERSPLYFPGGRWNYWCQRLPAVQCRSCNSSPHRPLNVGRRAGNRPGRNREESSRVENCQGRGGRGDGESHAWRRGNQGVKGSSDRPEGANGRFDNDERQLGEQMLRRRFMTAFGALVACRLVGGCMGWFNPPPWDDVTQLFQRCYVRAGSREDTEQAASVSGRLPQVSTWSNG